MNTEMEVVVAGLIGFVIGAVLVWIIVSGNKGKQSAETAKLQAEYDKYREQVNAHFAKTADAVDGLTQSYQQVFEHLSDGAQNLMDKKALQDQLEKRQGKAVTLAYLVDQDEASKSSVSKVQSSSIVGDGKNTIDPLVKKEAPVPAEEKADVIAHANHLKTPADKSAQAPASKVDENVAVKTTSAKPDDVTNTKPEVTDGSKVDATTAKPVPVAEKKDEALPKTGVNDADKNGTPKGAEKADLKPAETIVSSNHHESAIDSVKKHIKDGDKGSKA